MVHLCDIICTYVYTCVTACFSQHGSTVSHLTIHTCTYSMYSMYCMYVRTYGYVRTYVCVSAAPEIDPYDLLDPVNVLGQIPKDFYESIVR